MTVSGPNLPPPPFFFLPFLLSLGQVDSLLPWAVFCFSLLPPFSKDSDASGLDPTLSINQFKSNKCGILSRMVCIPLVWKAVLSCSMSVCLVFFSSSLIWVYECFFLPFFILHRPLPCLSKLRSTLCYPAFLTSLLSKPAFVLHTPGFPFLLSQPYILYHNQLRQIGRAHV